LIDAAERPVTPPNAVTAMGWEIYPEGLAETLRWLHDRYRFPRYLITENGAAMDDRPDASGFVDDQGRIDYLRSHLRVVREVIDEGIPVGGYFAWSLLDNFEWAWGYTQRFGLIRVDYDTLERVPKASAGWYGGVARANALT
jgi:beta-glucosidase